MTTWLSPYLSSYRKAYGENPTMQAVKRMGKVFKELEQEYPREEIAARFLNYCRGTEMRYYSAERFAVVFPAWKSCPGPVAKPVLTKWVATEADGRVRLIEVSIDDPRKAV